MPEIKHLIIRCMAEGIYNKYYEEIVGSYGFKAVFNAEKYLIKNCKTLVNLML